MIIEKRLLDNAMGYMKNLFSKNQIEAKLKIYNLDSKIIEKAREIATRWLNNVDLTKETENQESFLREFFIDILGYQAIAGKTNNSLWWESGSIVDGKKPDGILGFNLNSYKSDSLTEKVGDIRVVIELKDSSVNLDKKQQRKDYGGTPVEQGFRYASKVGGKCEFVIIANFSEIRLYKSSDQSKFHSFKLEDLANDDNKIKEFHFLLAKDRLFTKNFNQSPAHEVDTTAKGEDIEKRFYKHYSTLRAEIWHNLLELNAEKHYGRNFYLYKAQKLIDRIIFIRFCKENGALDNDAVIQALDQKFIKGKYNRMKHLFTAMNEGNPEIGIAKFNGGLFAEDKDLDSLEISDEIIDKIVILYSYDFGSDLDVNILGHIFEQSISDLENLTGNNEKKRKKDGVFYTPAYITEYIVKEAVGGWLADRKAEITAKEGSKEWWFEYAEKLKSIKILDPACGSGAFLVKVFDYLQNEWQEVPEEIKAEIKAEIKTDWTYKDILTNNIYGVDINPASVSITKLSLWLKTAHYRESLTTLDDNIKIGNSLIDDEVIAGYYSEFEGKIVQEYIKSEGSLFDSVAIEEIKNEGVKKSLAFKWEKEFKEVFDRQEYLSKSINVYHLVFATHNSRYSQRMVDIGIEVNSLNGLEFSLEQEIVITNIFLKIAEENNVIFRVLAYNICKDHVHLLICCEDNNLTNIVRILKGKSARLFNEYSKINNRQIWGQKYSSRIVKDEEQLENNVNYVVNNRYKHHLQENKELEAIIKLMTADFYQKGIEKIFSELESNLSIIAEIGNKGLQPLALNSTDRFIDSSSTHYPSLSPNPYSPQGAEAPCCRKKEIGIINKKSGFDVVVGNPPYVNVRNIDKKAKEYLTSKYKVAKEQYDLYTLFIERGRNLLVRCGYLSFIIPDKFMIADYGKPLINMLYQETEIKSFQDYTSKQVFEGASVYPVVIVVKNHTVEKQTISLAKTSSFLTKIERVNKVTDFKVWRPLASSGDIESGSNVIVSNSEISRYGIDTHRKGVIKTARTSDIQKNKILLKKLCYNFEASFDNEGYHPINTTYCITTENTNILYLLSLLNSKLFSNYAREKYKQTALRGGYIELRVNQVQDLPFIQIPLTEQQPFITLSQTMLDLTKQFNELSNKFTKLLSADLGVAKVTRKIKKWHNLEGDEFFAEVGKQNKTLSLSKKSQWLEHFEAEKQKAVDLQNKISKTDAEIDKMVYELYGLSDEEIKIIEGIK